MNPLLPKQVKFDKINFGNLRTQDNGSKSVFIGNNGGPLVIQTPGMFTAFAMNKYNPGGEKIEVDPEVIEKYAIQLSLQNMEKNVAIANFHNFIKGLDAFALSTAMDNSKTWFKKEYKPEVLAELYTSGIHHSKDKDGEINEKWAPTFKLNVPVKNGKVICDCVDQTGSPIELGMIPKGSLITAILQNTGLWFAGGNKFGYSWKIIKLMVKVPMDHLKAFAFQEDPDGIPGNDEEKAGPSTRSSNASDQVPDDDDDVPSQIEEDD
jgi:hypothetical protein